MGESGLPPAVVDGVLQRISATQVQSFQLCPRRWWFTRVGGLEDPGGDAADKGKASHDRIERYLKTGVNTLVGFELHMMRFMPPVMHPGVGAEMPVALKIAGVPLVGKIDAFNATDEWVDNEGINHPMPDDQVEVVDWKTTSSLKWAKTAEQLKKTVQMVVYGLIAFDLLSWLKTVRLSHGIGVRGSSTALKVSSVATKKELDDFAATNIIPSVISMKQRAGEKTFNTVEPNYESCYAFHKPCPFLSHCKPSALSAFKAMMEKS